MEGKLEKDIMTIQKNEPINLDIWGVCTTRDIIGFTNTNEIKVQTYFQSSFVPNFINKSTQKAEILPNEIVLPDKDNSMFWKKIYASEYNNTILDTYLRSSADWILVDLRSILKGNFKVCIQGIDYYYSYQFESTSDFIKKNIIKYWEKNGISISTDDIIKIEFEEIPECLHIFNSFCEFIKKRYGPNIILNELRQPYNYIDETGKVISCNYLERNRCNRLMNKYSEIFLSKTNAKCIRIPSNIVGDRSNPWGPGDVHYVREYYEYALDCVLSIIKEPLNTQDLLSRHQSFTYELDKIHGGEEYSEFYFMKTQMKSLSNCTNFMELDEVVKNICNGSQKFSKHLNGSICIEFARAYRKGFEGVSNKYAAKYWFKKALDWGNCECVDEYLDLMYITEDPFLLNVAYEYSIKGVGVAMGRLGRIFREGIQVKKNYTLATYWMRKAADMNVTWARYELFDLLWLSNTKTSFDEMIALIEPLAKKSDPKAMRRLGQAYLEGRGVPQNIKKGQDYIKKAAELGEVYPCQS